MEITDKIAERLAVALGWHRVYDREMARVALESVVPLVEVQAPLLLASYYEEGNSGEGQDIARALREDAEDFAEWLTATNQS